MKLWPRLGAVAEIVVLGLPVAAITIWLGATVAAFGMARTWSGLVAGLAGAAIVVCLVRCFGRKAVLPALIVYLVQLFLYIGDAASWFMQGSSFNERFFAHVNVDNIRVSVEAYPWAIVGTGLALVLLAAVAGVYLARIARGTAPRWLLLPALLLPGLVWVVDAPTHRLHAYFHAAKGTELLARSKGGDSIRAMLDLHPSGPGSVTASKGRNLVFIYLESVERTYTDESRFPGLTPAISTLRAQGLDFSGFSTFPGVTYTISGIFSSQCGAPYLINSIFGDDFGKLGFVPNNDNTSAGSFHPELACMGDVLHAAGYDQIYLSGVALGFANTDVFFHMHHYDQALGRPQIEALHGGKLPTEGWGLRDSDMYAEALAQYRQREAGGKPFSVVFSTIDTHPPKGYVLPGCTPYAPIRNDMLDAIHCADQLLGQFVDTLSREPDWKDTVVVVMSDHVSMRNVASPLYPPDDQRKPLLFVLNAGVGVRPAHMYHMDIAPTTLALMGVHSNVRFMAGANRGAADSRGASLPASALAQAVVRDELWSSRKPPALCDGGKLIGWNGHAGLDLGGWSLPLMLGGFPVSKIDSADTLLVFVDQHSAQLQILPKGGQAPWVKRARETGASLFQASPFLDGHGQPALALDWLDPKGSWASLGSVPQVEDIHLQSRRCTAAMQQVAQAGSGTRLDLSDTFGTTAIPAPMEPYPGRIISAGITADAKPAAATVFMFGRLKQMPDSYPAVITRLRRISLVPGMSRNALAEFDVSGLASLDLQPRIDDLMGSCRTRTDTGIVGVQISLDGKPFQSRFIVDRKFERDVHIPLAGAKSLRVDVDPGNTINDCDYFALGFSRVAPTGVAAQVAGAP